MENKRILNGTESFRIIEVAVPDRFSIKDKKGKIYEQKTNSFNDP